MNHVEPKSTEKVFRTKCLNDRQRGAITVAESMHGRGHFIIWCQD